MSKESQKRKRLANQVLAQNRQQRNVSHQSQVVQSVTTFKLAQYQGPIPPPELLREFDDVVPNGAERIFRQFELQSEHRRDLEKNVITQDQRRSNWGLASGTLVAVSAIVVCGIAAYKGQVTASLIGVFGTIATLASVFVYGTRERKKERIERAKAQTPVPPK